MPNYTVGLDLGQARDYSALVVTERVQVPCRHGVHTERFEPVQAPDDAYGYMDRMVYDEHHVRHIQRWQLGTPYPSVVDDVATLMQSGEFRRRAVLVLDATGVGGAVADMFTQAYRAGRLGDVRPRKATLVAGFSRDTPAGGGLAVGSIHKGDLVARLLSLLERGRLKMPLGLPVADALEKELRAFKLKQNKRTGNVSFEAARESDHDDLVIALALSVWNRHRHDEPRYLDNGEPSEKSWALATNPGGSDEW